jgi:hypothetical protein
MMLAECRVQQRVQKGQNLQMCGVYQISGLYQIINSRSMRVGVLLFISVNAQVHLVASQYALLQQLFDSLGECTPA